MSGNATRSSAVPMSGSRGPRLRAIACVGLLVTMGCAALVGCGKKPTLTAPQAHYDPDLRAYSAWLYWGPDIPIGRARDARFAGIAGATQVTHDANVVVVGTSATPAFRVTTQGVSGWYQARIYVDDQLWWNTGGLPPSAPLGVVDHVGKTWVPADTGVHVFRLIADPDSLVDEIDETNNEMRFEVKVIPADVRCSISRFIQWREGYPHEVNEVQVNTPVDIVVLTSAEGSYPNVRQLLNACGVVLLDRRISLSGGTLYNAWGFDTLHYTPTTTGTCQIRFDVDPDGEFPMDRDRRNNTSSRTLTVLP
jgi:hypothetical protein